MLVLDAIFRVVGVKRTPKSNQKSMRKLALKKVASEGGRDGLALSGLGARRGRRGEANLPPGVRRFGKCFRRMEDRMKGGRIYTLNRRVGGLSFNYTRY